MKPSDRIVAQLEQARTKLGSVRELARICGVHETSVFRWLNGKQWKLLDSIDLALRGEGLDGVLGPTGLTSEEERLVGAWRAAPPGVRSFVLGALEGLRDTRQG